ncbi:MAG: DUF4282 domain-containing protein [Planctomycetaceae bacterium]
MADFYYRNGDTVVGPLTGIQLRDAAFAGQVGLETPVAQTPIGPWHLAGRINGLFGPDGKPLPHPSEVHREQVTTGTEGILDHLEQQAAIRDDHAPPDDATPPAFIPNQPAEPISQAATIPPPLLQVHDPITPTSPTIPVKHRRRRRQTSDSLADLFDFSFRRFVTPLVVKIIYGLYVAIGLVVWLGWSFLMFTGGVGTMVSQADASNGTGDSSVSAMMFVVWIFGSLAYLLGFGWGLLILRLGLESVMVMFRMEDHLSEIANG